MSTQRSAAESAFDHGIARAQQGALEAAATAFAEAARLRPNYAEAHNNLGIVSAQLGRFADAAAAFATVVALRPEIAAVQGSLGNALAQLDRPEEALAAFERAAALDPRLAPAHANIGAMHDRLGRPAQALAAFDIALALAPGDVQTHLNRGLALRNLGDLAAACLAFERAIALAPAMVEAHVALGYALLAQGLGAKALAHAQVALDAKETASAKRLFCEALAASTPTAPTPALVTTLERALREAWTRPSDLARPALALIGDRPDPHAPLLAALLRAAIFSDAKLEAWLTQWRRRLLTELDLHTEAHLDFACALAEHCFNNEFVFASDVEEEDLAAAAARRLVGSHAPDIWDLVVAACYAPLGDVAGAAEWLAQTWPAPVAALLAVQVAAPAREKAIGLGLPKIGTIAAPVSLAVQAQYEANPYPRWTRLPAERSTVSAAQTLRARFGYLPFDLGARTAPDILIAGCGTGQHAVERALEYPAAKILAVDLSLASLGYAARKAEAMGVGNLEFAHADLLQLGNLDRQFDIVESVGVLHHLADPQAGFAVLAARLRTDGLFRIGLYSAHARATVVAVRDYIAARGFTPTAADIRRCRQELRALPPGDPRRLALDTFDFGSTGGCRDLFFHVQEHRHTLPEIAGWLQRFGFAFLGFDVAADVARAFAQAFPDPGAKTDLKCWDEFERRHPLVFSGMYQFWAQKKSG
jgi:tetratricopeptide (TPR) repeat protein/SAM-dependent methyltransferase